MTTQTVPEESPLLLSSSSSLDPLLFGILISSHFSPTSQRAGEPGGQIKVDKCTIANWLSKSSKRPDR